MKLKKLILAAASAMLLAGCSNVNEPTVVPQEEEYVRAFIKKVGVFDGDHNWCAAQSGAITIMPENEVKELKVYGYTDGEYYLVADYSNVTKPETIRFDMPTGTESVMVMADGVSYTAPINGYIDLTKAQGTAMSSRAGNVNDEGYTWIIAVEDLGGAYDFDFNDAVIGLNTINFKEGGMPYAELKFTALAAGGTLPLYIKFNFTDDYRKVGTKKNSIAADNKLFPDGTDASKCEFHNWFGEGYASTTMINTGKGVSVSREQCKRSTIYVDNYFSVSQYEKVKNGQLFGISLEVKTSNGTRTITNNPTQVYPSEHVLLDKSKYIYYGTDEPIIIEKNEDIDALKNLDSNYTILIDYSVSDDVVDCNYLNIQLCYPEYFMGASKPHWQVCKEGNNNVESGKIINKSSAGDHVLEYKPSGLLLESFGKEDSYKDNKRFVINLQDITLNKISIVPSEKKQDYLTAPQMFIIPDLGNGGKWQWPTETTCIVDAYSNFADWCKTPNKETNEWHLNSPVEGTTISR